MSVSARIAPPNSLLLVSDERGGEIPQSQAGALLTFTSSCIAIGSLCEIDGETEITLGQADEVDPGGEPHFEGSLETPTRRLAVRTVLGDTVLEVWVPDLRTSLRIWVNDSAEPDKIVVGFH